jgi:hypothetical protein
MQRDLSIQHSGKLLLVMHDMNIFLDDRKERKLMIPCCNIDSFATGWNYVFKYFIGTPTNLTAAGLVVQYWRPDLNVAIWVTIFGIAVISINVRSEDRHYPPGPRQCVLGWE